MFVTSDSQTSYVTAPFNSAQDTVGLWEFCRMSIGDKLTGVTTRTVTETLHGETLPPLVLPRAQNLYCPMPIGLSGVHDVFVVLARTTWPVVRLENKMS